jgi:O-antigen/teichoic acid export membrane protein
MSGIRGVAKRLSWGLGDQAVSSMSNFLVGLVVARELGVASFGVFSLAWVTYGVILNVSRGLATDPLVVRFSGVPAERWREATAHAAGTALAVGTVFGVVSAIAGLLMGGTLGSAFIALAVVTPGMLLQDAWRFAFFAAGHGHKAFVNDVVWAVAMIPLLFLAGMHSTVWTFILAWGAAALLAALYGWWQCRIASPPLGVRGPVPDVFPPARGGPWARSSRSDHRARQSRRRRPAQSGVTPHFAGMRDWLRTHRDLGARYMVENVSNSGASQLRMYGLGAIAGLADVGAIRGAELLLGPFLALLMGVSLVAVPEAARVLRRAPHRLAKFCLVIGGAQAAAAATWGLALLLVVPDSVGRLLLDEVWEPASHLILPVSLSVTAAGVIAGATAGLRALGAARRSLRVQLVASAGYLGFGLTGAALGGAVGMSWGSTTAMWLGAGLWWLQLRAALREHTPEPQPELVEVRG